MSGAVLALGLGTVLAVGALAFVLYPIFFGVSAVPRRAPRPMTARVGAESLTASHAVAALREIEFDRATGKLSDADYTQLKDRYLREALATLRDADRMAAVSKSPIDDEIEAAILEWRARHPECAVCGPRPESDAVFCSSCGRYLPGVCAHCSARIDELGARFCRACGHRLAA